MTAPIGNIVSLYMDTRWDLEEGDIIQSQSGRSYRIVGARQQTRGTHIGRWHLQALVIDRLKIADTDRVVPFRWYSRNRRKP